MDLQHYIGIELSGLKRAMDRALDSLTQQEVTWRPASGCNSIGIILLHTARSEDSFIQGLLQKKPQIWTSEKWYEKLNLTPEDDGAHFTVEQVNAFPVPELSSIRAYYDAVRVKTKEHLRAMAIEDFDKKISFPNYGEMPATAIFSLLVSHTAEHIGEIGYLRGLQRGMDK
jgi:uncharacterized damage-inducible protein DinB